MLQETHGLCPGQSLVVVLPCYNEGERVLRLQRALAKAGLTALYVDDGSSDETAFALRAAGELVLRHPTNLGQGAALCTAFQYLWRTRRSHTFSHVGTFDADEQHQIGDLINLHSIAKDRENQIVLGSRFKGAASSIPLFRGLVLRGLVGLRNSFRSFKLTDTHNGLRVFPFSLLEYFQDLPSGMAHADFMESAFLKSGLPIREEPVLVRYTSRRDGKASQSLLNGFNIVLERLETKYFG